MSTVIGLLYAAYEGFWRRWFGGLFDDKTVLGNRFLQHIFGFLGCFGILYYNGLNIWLCLLSALVLRGLYWARSHGCCFDFGHGKVDIKRYEQLWYWKYVKKIIPENELYGFWCDYILMTVRYTLPSILFAIVSLNVPCIFIK